MTRPRPFGKVTMGERLGRKEERARERFSRFDDSVIRLHGGERRVGAELEGHKSMVLALALLSTA